MFTLFVIGVGEYTAFAVVLVAAVLTFAPINFLHPVRVVRLRTINLAVFLAWCVFGIIALLQNMNAHELVRIGIGVTGVYLFCIGGIMQALPQLGRKGG